uniref:Zinc finger BED domain-containing protein 1 n=1 Tax=Sipha flava TaxID=143950 RepID=A0A2S2R2N3_9HEMI
MMQTNCLICTSLDVDHTSFNLRDIIESTLVDWGIQISNISGATTDNETNVIKAVELFGINDISCFGHTLNNGLTSSMSLSPVQTLLSKISKLRFKFHYRSKLRRLLKEAQKNIACLKLLCLYLV